MTSKTAEEKNLSYKKTIVFSVIAGFLLLIANSAYWMNSQIFNTQAFTATVTSSLTSESSRTAMSQEITDRIYQDRPAVKRIAGNFTTKVIGGLLATNQFQNVLTPAVERIQLYATSSVQEDVAVELTGIKDVITKIVKIAENTGNDINLDPDNIPSQIVLIEADSIPDLYKIGVIFLWIAPFCLLAALILLAYPYLKVLNDKRSIIFVQGTIITLFGIIGLLVGPLFKPPVLANVTGINGRVIVGNLYDAFINTFNSQTSILILLGVLMVLISVMWIGYPYAKKTTATFKK